MEITSYELSDINHDQIKYVVLLAEYKGELLLIRHKERTLWEFPGGKREAGESLLQAASRELFEETGALQFKLTPFSIYQINSSFGMNFHAEILELGELPAFEIAEIRLSKTLPSDLNHGAICSKMYEEWNQIKSKKALNTYKVDHQNGVPQGVIN